jgi:O-antigen/teichoic acid export membrane protein
MLVTLYTSRVVLDALGIEDFGTYNVVGGVVYMLAFFISSLSNATQRFLSIEIGRNDNERASHVFSLSLILYAIICVCLVLLFETVGLWFLNHKLVISSERMIAANWVYQFTIITCILGIIQVPFVSAIVSHENMGVYAYVGIFDVIAKLVIAYILTTTSSIDRLILYSFLMLVVQVLINLFYYVFCFYNFRECRLCYYWEKSLAKSMLQFIGYNLFGCLAYSASYSGINIILNLFFGPVINAAQGISAQVSGALMRFNDSIITAVKPQIIKSYSVNNVSYMLHLVLMSSKYSFLLLWLLSLPVIFNIDYILDIWLKEIPYYTSIFIQLMVVDSLIAILIPPLWMAANATGHIGRQQFFGRIFTLVTLPVSYVVLKLEWFSTPLFVFVCLVLAQLSYYLYCFWDIHRQLSLSVPTYIHNVVIPLLKVVIPSYCILQLISLVPFDGFLRFMCLSFVSVVVVFLLIYKFAVNANERNYIKNWLRLN